MSIIDRARDAIKRLGGGDTRDMGRAANELLIAARPNALAVVRVAALADEIDAEADRVAATGNEFYAEAIGGFAARIRAALERSEE